MCDRQNRRTVNSLHWFSSPPSRWTPYRRAHAVFSSRAFAFTTMLRSTLSLLSPRLHRFVGGGRTQALRCASSSSKAPKDAGGVGGTNQGANQGANQTANQTVKSSAETTESFAKRNPFAFQVGVATVKTSAADLMTQTVAEKKSLGEVDWRRNMIFVVFGSVYLGCFQW